MSAPIATKEEIREAIQNFIREHGEEAWEKARQMSMAAKKTKREAAAAAAKHPEAILAQLEKDVAANHKMGAEEIRTVTDMLKFKRASDDQISRAEELMSRSLIKNIGNPPSTKAKAWTSYAHEGEGVRRVMLKSFGLSDRDIDRAMNALDKFKSYKIHKTSRGNLIVNPI